MRRLCVALATFALLTGFPTTVMAGTTSPTPSTVSPAIAIQDSCWFFSKTTRGSDTCRVPDGVTTLTFEIRAGNGGRGYGQSGPTAGGQGATISGSIAVTSGETLYITVGSAGWGWDNYPAKNNGGGGGYSSIAHMVSDVLTPLAVAGGGGGAGTADQNSRPYVGGAGGNGGTTVTTRGGGAGGTTGTSSSSATNGEDGGTTSIGGAAGSAYGFAGGGVGVDGSRLSTDTWLLGDARPGAGGGGFAAIGGYGNPTKWVPAGTPRSADYTGAFGAGGEGSTDGGGGGGGGYAGGGGGGSGTVYDSTGGGGGGSSLVPEGATASIVTTTSPHAWLRPSGTATLFVEPNAQSINGGDPVPAASFYTFAITDGTSPVMASGLQTYTAPTCGSAYTTATTAASLPISCGGGSNHGTAGSATGVTFDYSHTAVLTIIGAADLTPPTLTLAQADGQSDPTSQSPVNFSLVADEALDTSSVGEDDFAVTGGTIGTIDCSGDPTTCTIPVTPTGDGPVTIAPSTAFFAVADVSGNIQTTAGGTDRSVVYDGTPPVVTASSKLQGSKITITYDVTGAESFVCKLNDVTITCANPWTRTLVKGDYTFTIEATDSLARTTTTDVTFTIKSGKIKS